MVKTKKIQMMLLFLIIIVLILIISLFLSQFLGQTFIEPPPVPESIGIPIP